MSEQDDGQVSTLQCPKTDDKEAWKGYWKATQPKSWFEAWGYWRTEPEIGKERQKELARYRVIVSDIEKGIYPFKDIEPKLTRADVEWLLATHENGRGPVDWKDKSQRGRKGLDLRGADLQKADLQGLPLACLCGGLSGTQSDKPKELRNAASIILEEANLDGAYLQNAVLNRANLVKATLSDAHLEKARLLYADIRMAKLDFSHLKKAYLFRANLDEADLSQAHLEKCNLVGTHLKNAVLLGAYLQNAVLQSAYLAGADIDDTNLENADLFNITLADKNGVGPRMADIHWGDTNLAIVDWSQVKTLRNEYPAKRTPDERESVKKSRNLYRYEKSVRAYRQLAIALRNQGLNEDAARFAYRSQLMQRRVFQYQRKFGQYLFSLFLDLLSGYGYKPIRSFMAYLIVITAFATAYFIIGHTAGPVLSPLGSVVFSMTSFHGRGFFPGGIGLDDPLTVVAALEAFVGLLIEVTFIATLTQRLFGK